MRISSFAAAVFAAAIIFLGSISSPALAGSWACADLFSGNEKTRLSPETYEALSELENGRYTTAVRHVQIGGRDRVIVIVGEAHIKNADDTRRFLNVMGHFAASGFEGLNFEKYWFGKYIKKLFEHERDEENSHGSSTYTLQTVEFARKAEADIAAILANEIIEKDLDLESRVRELKTGNYIGEIRRQIDASTIAYRDKLFELAILDQVRMDEIIQRIQNNVRDYEVSETTSVETNGEGTSSFVFNLEDGYRPSWREQFAATGLAFMNTKALGFCAMTCLYGTLGAYFVTGYHPVVIGSGFATFAALASLRSSKPTQRLMQVINATERRNAEMVKGLRKSLEQNPSVDSLLIVVGQKHVPGIAALLDQRK